MRMDLTSLFGLNVYTDAGFICWKSGDLILNVEGMLKG